VEKAVPWKSPKADFSTALENPATAAGFSLFPPPGYGGELSGELPETICARIA